MVEALLIVLGILVVLGAFVLAGMVLLIALFSAANCCEDYDDADV